MQKTCFEVLRFKTCSTFTASYMFPFFSPQCFLCNPEGSCLIRSPNSVDQLDPEFGVRRTPCVEKLVQQVLELWAAASRGGGVGVGMETPRGLPGGRYA